MTFWLCLVVMTPAQSSAQQPSVPVAQATGADQPKDPAQAPAAPGDDSTQPATTPKPAPVAINPKTGLPYTPDELREKEIDKYDPLKRDQDTPAATPQQGSTPLTDRKQPDAVADPAANAAPLPGSVAASNQAAAASGSKKTQGSGQGSAQASTQDSDSPEEGDSGYSGPAVLTRSYTLSRPLDATPIKWTGSLGLSYSWDDGQAPGLVNGAAGFVSARTSSAAVTWNLGGRHRWKRDQIGLTYAGNYSEYFAQNSFSNLSGLNNSLNLDYNHVFSQRFQFHLVESLQDLSQNYPLENPALQPGSSVANINLSTSPTIQLLNNTVHQSSTQAGVTYRQTARLSFDGSVSYFIIGQTEAGLTGMTGEQFSGDLNYRWTSRTTVGAYYQYTDYNYSHNVSHATSNGAGLIYSYAINRHMQLRTRLGVSQIKSRAYETIALPPQLAAILGQSESLINASSGFTTTDVSAQLVRDFGKNRTASLGFARGESPGNGLLLTSVQETATAGFSSSFFRRRVPVNVGATYSTLNATLQANLGSVKSESVYFSTSRPISHRISSSFSANYGNYTVGGTSLTQHFLTLSIGLAWSPRLDRVLPF
jgi:hypothetical protein